LIERRIQNLLPNWLTHKLVGELIQRSGVKQLGRNYPLSAALSRRKVMRDIAQALYLKRNLAVMLPTGEIRKIVRPPTKQDVYHQLQCIYHESAPSRSTVSRWLKQLEDAQPALEV
jgi:hypothetical protein